MNVSVVIPVYNAQNTIVQCLNSVVLQDYKDIEIIVIDDGSKDNSVKIVEDYIGLNNEIPIKLIKQKNSGPSAARNRGIENSSGNIIAFLDSDDYWVQDKLRLQLNLMEEKKCDAVFASHTNKTFQDEKLIKKITFKDMLYKNYFFSPSSIVKKEILNTIGGFNESQKYSEDYRLGLLITYNTPVYFINKVLSLPINGKNTFGDTGLSANLKQMELGELSNYTFLYKNKMICLLQYLRCSGYSIMKFFRRILIVKFRKLSKSN